MAPVHSVPAERQHRRSARLLEVAVLAAVGLAGVLLIGPAFIPAQRTPAAGPRGASVAGLRGRIGSSTALRAEEDGEGFLKFLKVEQDIELSPEEYKLALEQEVESQRKKYYIGGKVKPGNLIVPWKDVVDSELLKDAKQALKKNGIVDPEGEQATTDEDSGIGVQVVGEQDVRLDWTAGEPGTRVGYIVERKRAMDSNFREIATYENMGTPFLLAKSYKGHDYSYSDTLVDPGAYTYRVLYRLRSGQIVVVDQKDITVPELSGTDNFTALGVFLVFVLITVAYGVIVDQPILS